MAEVSQIPYRILATFGYNYKGLNGRKTEVIYYCPECINRKGTPDTSGHLYVNLKSYKYFCMRCGYTGQIGRHISISSSRLYDEEKNHELEETLKEISQVVEETPPEFSLKVPIDKVTTSSTATQYLLSRGFTYDQMSYYDMRVGNLHQEFGRIIIPNQVHKRVYTDTYSARSYIGQTPKYHNPSGIKKSEVVFNLHRIKEGTPIILVEGVLTAVAAGYHAVASLGKSLSLSQASQIIQKSPSVIYVNYDYGAEESSHQACQLLYKINPQIPIKEVLMKDDRDAADMSRTEYVECLQRAQLYQPLYSELMNLISETD